MNSSRVASGNSSELLFDLTQDTGLSHYQGGPTLSIAGLFYYFFKKLKKVIDEYTYGCFEVHTLEMLFSYIVRQNGTNLKCLSWVVLNKIINNIIFYFFLLIRLPNFEIVLTWHYIWAKKLGNFCKLAKVF